MLNVGEYKLETVENILKYWVLIISKCVQRKFFLIFYFRKNETRFGLSRTHRNRRIRHRSNIRWTIAVRRYRR